MDPLEVGARRVCCHPCVEYAAPFVSTSPLLRRLSTWDTPEGESRTRSLVQCEHRDDVHVGNLGSVIEQDTTDQSALG